MTVEEILERLKGLQRYHVVVNDLNQTGTSAEKDDYGWWAFWNDIEKLIHEIEAAQ